MSLLFDIHTPLSHWRHPFLLELHALARRYATPTRARRTTTPHSTSDLPFVRILTGTYWFLIGRSSAHFRQSALFSVFIYIPLDGGLCVGPFFQSRLVIPQALAYPPS